MAPIDSQDAKLIADELDRRAATRRDSVEQRAIDDATPVRLKVVAMVVGVAVALVSGLAIAQSAKGDAEKALDKTADLEPRVVRLEEQRRADAELLRDTVNALKKNTEVLQAVQVELAKKK